MKQKLRLRSKTSVTSKLPKRKRFLMTAKRLSKSRLTSLPSIRRVLKSTRPNLRSRSHLESPKKLKRE